MQTKKIDIILAKKSSQFKEKARQLGFQNLIFALTYQETLNLRAVDAIVIKTNSLKELRKQTNLTARNNKKAIIIPQTEISRAAFENKQTWLVVMPELNHVLCNLARKNNITIAIDFSLIRQRQTGIKEKAKILNKMLKIARLCRKYKTKIVIASFAEKLEDMVSAKDIEAFANSLGLL